MGGAVGHGAYTFPGSTHSQRGNTLRVGWAWAVGWTSMAAPLKRERRRCCDLLQRGGGMAAPAVWWSDVMDSDGAVAFGLESLSLALRFIE